MIVLSVAHTRKARGAGDGKGLYEHEVSQRASRTCYDTLYAAGVPCAMFELGFFSQVESVGPKQTMPGITATLAVEIHCNASEDTRFNYSEAIHYPGSVPGRRAAEHIVEALRGGFSGNHAWPSRGARGDGSLFFLKGKTPAVIVEGLFISNAEQAAFLASPGGAEAYGHLIAEGLIKWWRNR